MTETIGEWISRVGLEDRYRVVPTTDDVQWSAEQKALRLLRADRRTVRKQLAEIDTAIENIEGNRIERLGQLIEEAKRNG